MGASFLNELSEGIDRRTEKAERYEEEQRELAERNASIVNTRNLRAQEAALIGQKAIQLGAREQHVKAAMASGMTGVSELYTKLQQAANEKGVKTLGEDDIEAIINMPTIPSINPKYVDMGLKEFAQITYGVAPRQEQAMEPEGNLLKKLFALDDMAVARNKLRTDKYMGDLSIADINEAARQAEYTSLFPDLGMTLMDVEFYGPEDAGEFIKEFQEAVSDATNTSTAKLAIQGAKAAAISKAQEAGLTLDPDDLLQIEAAAKKQLEKEAVTPLIEATIGRFGRGGFFDNPTSFDLVEKVMGADYLATQMELFGQDVEEEEPTLNDREENLGSAEAIRTGMDEAEARTQAGVIEQEDTSNQEEETTQTETPDTETKKAALLTKTFPTRKSQRGLAAKGIWDSKYEGKVDPDTGRAIIVEPRPPAGGDKTKELPVRVGLLGSRTGKTKKVTEAEYWDTMYAETHNVDGTPKGL